MPKRISVSRVKELFSQIAGEISIGAHIVPKTTAAYDIGSESSRLANIYTSDLHLKNERGDYTIVEEEEYLSVRNNKTNKLYKFVLEEIQEEGE